ncbi:hypothetical protein HY491_00235 [Candidatus Woesearchaeota archaeon]|nr:hypothetical protein [Candidatus Woesearchaeota archaeon]
MIFSTGQNQQEQQDEEQIAQQRRVLDQISSKFSQEYDEFVIGMQQESKHQEQAEQHEKQKAKKRVERFLRPYDLPRNGINYYQSFAVYTPAGTSVQRVSQAALGHGVLGRAFLGLGIIQILDTLYGQEFQEVMKHEVNHILYPFLTEHQIRQKTRQELPFYASFH